VLAPRERRRGLVWRMNGTTPSTRCGRDRARHGTNPGRGGLHRRLDGRHPLVARHVRRGVALDMNARRAWKRRGSRGSRYRLSHRWHRRLQRDGKPDISGARHARRGVGLAEWTVRRACRRHGWPRCRTWPTRLSRVKRSVGSYAYHRSRRGTILEDGSHPPGQGSEYRADKEDSPNHRPHNRRLAVAWPLTTSEATFRIGGNLAGGGRPVDAVNRRHTPGFASRCSAPPIASRSSFSLGGLMLHAVPGPTHPRRFTDHSGGASRTRRARPALAYARDVVLTVVVGTAYVRRRVRCCTRQPRACRRQRAIPAGGALPAYGEPTSSAVRAWVASSRRISPRRPAGHGDVTGAACHRLSRTRSGEFGPGLTSSLGIENGNGGRGSATSTATVRRTSRLAKSRTS